ncbi:MAG TPA: oligosaccharide flippase family protein, partial [Burkholderiales bacterium]|nr:oligosaccharide flippase family protein [Burkholderiales bacterium]
MNRSIAAGAAWMIGLRLCVTAMGLISTLILARLLEPADFGLVALGTALVAAFDLLTNFRFDVPLIQSQTATREDYDSAWTLNLAMGLTLGLLLSVTAHPAARFFAEPRLSGVVFVLAGVAAVDGAQNIGVVNFRKEFAFGREFVFSASRKVASVLVGVVCAWVFRSYWALAAGVAASSAWGLVASYVMHPFRPRFCTRSTRMLLVFSKWLVLDNIVQFLRFRSSDLLIGRIVGTGSLGLFNIANEVAWLPQNTLT